MTKPTMRDQMPEVAAFIDQMRQAFGKEEIDQQIRRGMRGEPTFYARERGQVIGTPWRKEDIEHAKK